MRQTTFFQNVFLSPHTFMPEFVFEVNVILHVALCAERCAKQMPLHHHCVSDTQHAHFPALRNPTLLLWLVRGLSYKTCTSDGFEHSCPINYDVLVAILSSTASIAQGSSIEARWREVVPRRVAEVAPVRIFLHARESDVGSCRHVGKVQVQRDVVQGCALDLVQGGGVAQPGRKGDDAVLVCPRVYHDDLAFENRGPNRPLSQHFSL